MPTPLPPVDPDVKLPPSVAAAGARADALHAQVYANPPTPGQDPPEPPTSHATAVPLVPPQAPPLASPPPAPVDAPPPADRTPAAADLTADEWRHRYLSMEGRYKQSAQSIGVMQEQLSELGDELMRTQQALPRRANPPQQPQLPPEPLVTAEEIKTYGPELIDVIQRAARAAINPDLQNLHNGVRQVSQRVQVVSTGSLYENLDREVANWREVNISPRFKQWCALRDVYSGQVRGQMLNAAFTAADAPRVVAFFKGFLTEEQATGQLPDPSLQPPVPLAPRQAAVSLESLTAPGRAHPAGGDQPLPVDKPIFTRAQITAFYRQVREGYFNGREADKQATEKAIFAAQNEGRIR